MGNKKLILFAAIMILLKTSTVTQAAPARDLTEPAGGSIVATTNQASSPQPVSKPEDISQYAGADDIIASVNNPVNSSVTDQVLFYMTRDMETNRVLKKPETAKVTLTLKEGAAAISDIEITSSKNEITISNVSGNSLSQGGSISFDVDFWSEGLADGSVAMVKGSINILDSSQNQLKEIPVTAAADGLYSYYNSEFASTFAGTPYGNGNYSNIGRIDLNLAGTQYLTIKHLWKPVAASESYRLRTIQLDPNGYFEFPDGSCQQKANLKEDGYIEFQIRMKESSFQELKLKAVQQGQNIYQHVPLSELVFIYEGPTGNEDGFMIGGKGSSLPITYLLTYTSRSSGNSGGGGSSGGSGGGGSTTIVDTSTYNVAKESDNGWKLVDNAWYYYDSSNKLVKGWLLTLDNKWYYLGKDGKMMTGWVKPEDGKWYYLQENGVMLTGWYKTEDGKQYYLQSNGVMTTGWFQDTDEKWYYFLTSGEMAKNITTSDGYYINEDGVYIP